MSRKKKIEKEIEDEFSVAAKDTFPEKLGNSIINFVGSWTFLIINVVFFALWLIFRLYYDLLTFWVSLEAIVITLLILINATIKEKNDRQRAIKDYKIDLSVAKRLKKVEERLKKIEEKLE